MRRVTVSMPDDLGNLLEREAERRGTTVSEVVRMSLTRMLRGGERREIPWAGAVHEPGMVYGSEIDEALAEEWDDAVSRDRG